MVQVSRAALRQELELAKDFDGNVEEGHNVGVKGDDDERERYISTAK